MSTLPLNNEIVAYNDLLVASKCKNAAELVGWLELNQIPFFRGIGRGRPPFTTRAALNSALGVLAGQTINSGKVEVL